MKQIDSILKNCPRIQNRITNLSSMLDNKEYWYISVTNNCHWKLKVHSFVYDEKKCIDDMILFDNKDDANLCCTFLQNIANQLMILLENAPK